MPAQKRKRFRSYFLRISTSITLIATFVSLIGVLVKDVDPGKIESALGSLNQTLAQGAELITNIGSKVNPSTREQEKITKDRTGRMVVNLRDGSQVSLAGILPKIKLPNIRDLLRALNPFNLIDSARNLIESIISSVRKLWDRVFDLQLALANIAADTGEAVTSLVAQTLRATTATINDLTVDSLIASGIATFGGNIGSSFIPSSNNLYDLGTSSLRFRTAHLGTSVVVGGATLTTNALSFSGTGTVAATTLTDGTLSITGGNLSGAGTVSATSLQGDLSCINCLNATEIEDIYLFNTGDTASGNYNFDAGTLFINASSNRIGIGTTNPGATLTTIGNADITNQIIAGLSGGNPTIIRTGGPNTKGLIIKGAEISGYTDRWVAVGKGTNTIAHSSDGVNWTGLGTSTFDYDGCGVAWNGSMWVAVGEGEYNTIAYSTDGINWTGLGNSIFDYGGWDVAWNGSMWVAVGEGEDNTIAYSTDGINWTGLGNSIFDWDGWGVAWNGSMWVAVGSSDTNTIAYSTDGINWTGLGTSTFDYSGYGVAWNGSMWVAVGGDTNTIAYSSDGINWTGLGDSTFDYEGWDIAWNGSMWVAVGYGDDNTIAYSTDGINWTGLGNSIFVYGGWGVAWNGSMWVATGAGGNTLAYSSDGINWTGLGDSTFSNYGLGVASAPAPELVPPQLGVPSSTGQIANLQEWQDSSGTALAVVGSTGNLALNGGTVNANYGIELGSWGNSARGTNFSGTLTADNASLYGDYRTLSTGGITSDAGDDQYVYGSYNDITLNSASDPVNSAFAYGMGSANHITFSGAYNFGGGLWNSATFDQPHNIFIGVGNGQGISYTGYPVPISSSVSSSTLFGVASAFDLSGVYSYAFGDYSEINISGAESAAYGYKTTINVSGEDSYAYGIEARLYTQNTDGFEQEVVGGNFVVTTDEEEDSGVAVSGSVSGSGDSTAFWGTAGGLGIYAGGINTAFYGLAYNGTTNYALYADAYGGTDNWAVYAVRGESYFAESVGIGTTAPGYKLDLQLTSGEASGIRINQDTNPYTGTSDNAGLSLRKTINTPADSTGLYSVGIENFLINNHDVLDPIDLSPEIFTAGFYNEVTDGTGFSGNGGLYYSYKGTYGILNGVITEPVTDSSSGDTLWETAASYNYVLSDGPITVDKSSGTLGYTSYGAFNSTGAEFALTSGSLDAKLYGSYNLASGWSAYTDAYGVYAYGRVDGSGGGYGDSYGVYAEAYDGTTAYAVYATATNAATNYGIYSAAGTNYFSDSVGIGTTSPSYKLDVETDAASGYAAEFFNDGNNVNRYGIKIQAGADDGGAVGTTYYLSAYDGDGGETGNLKTVDGVFQLADVSDVRLKTNITDTGLGGLDIINNLRVVDFNWLSNPQGALHHGFIAQEAQEIFPYMVNQEEGGIFTTSKSLLIPVLVKAIQEQQAQLDADGELAQINADRIEQLSARVDELESLVGIETPPDASSPKEGIFDRIRAAIAEFVNLVVDTISAKVATFTEAIIDRLTVKKLAVEEPAVGSGTIPAGQTKVLITNSLVTNQSRIFITTTTKTDKALSVTEKIAGTSFTVEIAEPAEATINFDYWIIN